MTRPRSPNSAADASPRPIVNLLVIWRFVQRYPGHLLAALVSLVIAASATLSVPVAFRRVIDKGFGASDQSTITLYFLALLGIVAIMALATAMRFYFVTWIGERVVADIRRAVHAHLLTLSPEFFEENRPAEIAARLTADTTIIEQVVGTSASVALRNLLMGVGGMGLLFVTSPKLTAMLLIIIPATVIPIIVLGRRVRKLARSSQDRIAEIGAMADEALGALRVVQANTQEMREGARFGRAVDDAFMAARRRFSMRAIMTAMVMLLVFAAITFVLWEGARDVIAGRMTGGAITQFVLWAALVAGAFGALSEVYGDVMRAAGAAGRLGEILNTRSKIRPPDQPLRMPEPSRGAVAFESVGFHYPSKPDAPALEDFSLVIEPGETVALVGPSGAGKTTLFQLLQRFYDPDTGCIRIDGVDIRSADPRDVRQRLAVVPQETVIFATSAFENILYGRPEASESEVWEAAEAAFAADFLRAMPDGIHSHLGEAGVRLSGGQRQRLAIARAILRDAPILLLDEATSALDAESERAVQQALDRLMQNRTTLVIAHRLATVVRANRIVVMDQGRVVAQGSHEELLAQGGLYARLARLQFGAAEAAE